MLEGVKRFFFFFPCVLKYVWEGDTKRDRKKKESKTRAKQEEQQVDEEEESKKSR